MGRKALPRDEMDLTEREHRILDYLSEYLSSRGYPPTVREICLHLNIKSTSTIHRDLNDLEAKNFIQRDPSKPRALEILNSVDVIACEEIEKIGFADILLRLLRVCFCVGE